MRGRCEGCFGGGGGGRDGVVVHERKGPQKVPVCTMEHMQTLMQSSRLVTYNNK